MGGAEQREGGWGRGVTADHVGFFDPGMGLESPARPLPSTPNTFIQ